MQKLRVLMEVEAEFRDIDELNEVSKDISKSMDDICQFGSCKLISIEIPKDLVAPIVKKKVT